MKIPKISQIYDLLRHGKIRCLPCRLVHGVGGRRSDGIKVYEETKDYLIVNNLPEHKRPETTIFIVGFLKRHTADPTEAEKKTVEDALIRVAKRYFGLNISQFGLVVSMGKFPGHYHQHLFVRRRTTERTR